MTETWTTEDTNTTRTNTLEVAGNTVEFDGEIEASDILEAARNHNVKKFNVYDRDTDQGLNSGDAPFDRNIRVEEYNENAGA